MKLQQQQIIKPMTLEIDKSIWEKFKEKIPRTKKLNDAVVQLINKYINENDNDKKTNSK